MKAWDAVIDITTWTAPDFYSELAPTVVADLVKHILLYLLLYGNKISTASSMVQLPLDLTKLYPYYASFTMILAQPNPRTERKKKPWRIRL